MLTRIFTALPLIAGFLAALFLSTPFVWQIVTGIVLLLAGREWAGLARLHGFKSWLYALSVLVLAISVWMLGQAGTLPYLPYLPYLPSVAFWLFAPWLLQRGVRFENQAVTLVLGAVLLPTTWWAIVELRQHDPNLLLAVMGLVIIADSAAYFAGRQFGRNKLAPAISPGKTWEGVAGAALGVTLYTLALWQGWAQDALVAELPLLLLTAWLLLVVSILGDLFESWLKRLAGVKDSGTLLPGHGGVLDRIDSLMAALPVAALLWWMQ